MTASSQERTLTTLEELEAELATPSEALIADLAQLDGDLIILGAGGKMGPSLAKLARNALQQAGNRARVIAVSRFSSPELQSELEKAGIETHRADLLHDEELQVLPDAANVIFMAGTKFGTSSRASYTWASNAYLPGRVAQRYRQSRIVVFSSGNVYPLVPVVAGGSSEESPTGPIGEYAQSVLGRERVFEHFSRAFGTPVLLFRLNYAIDLRYGVLLEIARAVREGSPIDLRMGQVNVIWQGDANEMALRSLAHASTPPAILNVTGPEVVSVRWLAERFGVMMGREPHFQGEEQATALLSNASQAHGLFGYPRVGLREMMRWIVAWLAADGPTHDKPTHFQERQGAF
ncbi:MAG TPA: NAD(P)-dependent oxidoreductase [Trueperaceae bacterium]